MTPAIPGIFIGRKSEADALRTARDEAVDGQPRVVLLSGEAGIGKSALVRTFTAEAAGSGDLVLVGGCGERSAGSLPYEPLVAALRGLRAQSDWEQLRSRLSDWLAPLGRLVPSLAEGLPAATELDQAGLFEHVLAVIHALAGRAPVVLALEDLHWADQSSLDLISFLVRNVRDERLLLVVTYRRDELADTPDLRQLVGELVRDRRVSQLVLPPFGHDELGQLAREVLDTEVSAGFVDRLLRHSDGNPFFAEELLAAGVAGVDDPPEQVRDVVLSRVDRLAADTRAVLDACAVVGRPVDEPLLAELSKLDDQRLQDALREAIAHQVLLADAGQDTYRLRHWLAQNAIYKRLLHGRRRRLHAAVADALGDLLGLGADPALAAEVAHHWHAADQPAESFAASMHAGRTALRAQAYKEALGHLEYAHRLATERLPAGADIAAGLRPGELLELVAEAARWSGQVSRAVALARQAVPLVDAEGDRLRAGLLYDFLGRCLWEEGDSERSLAAYQRAIELLPDDAPGQARARAIAGEAGALMLTSRYRESKNRALDALQLARDVGAMREQANAMCTLGVDFFMLGDPAAAMRFLRDCLEIADRIDNLEELCRAYTNLTWVLSASGQSEESVRTGLEGLDRARRMGLEATGGGVLAGNVISALFRLGRWDEAGKLLDDLLPELTGIMRAHATQLQAALLTARGQLPEAAAALAEATGQAMRVTEAQLLGPLHAMRAELHILSHEPGDALVAVQDGLNAVAGSDDRHLEVRLCALGVRALGDLDERQRRSSDGREPALVREGETRAAAARRLRDMAQSSFTELATLGTPVAEASADLAECVAELGRLDSGDNPDDWDAALRSWQRLAQPYRAAYAGYRKAQALAVRPATRKAAAEVLRQAHHEAVSLGAAALVTAIEALAVAARLDLRLPGSADSPTSPASPASPADRFRLTKRELEILQLVARGWQNREIARRLGIAENTVGVHVGNIIRKLGVGNRTEVAVMASRVGLITD